MVNTDTSNLPGEHWLAVYISNERINVFDSFGFYYPDMLVTQLERINRPIVYNRIQYQDPLSTVCGQFCLLWLALNVL